jgi:XTP/dITP diphosphohydrolase
MSSSAPSIVLASRNRKKIAEMVELLRPHGIAVLSSADFAEMGEVVEDGTTFAENAAKKASETALKLGRWALGEDSGLAVDALKGAPGVYSARYSGANATDESNNAKLIADLQGVPDEKRSAHYVCSIAVADPAGQIQLRAEGMCRGRITSEPRGSNGFGYDPYFLILESHRTFGELGSVVKHHLSHRARAFERLIPQLVQTLRR